MAFQALRSRPHLLLSLVLSATLLAPVVLFAEEPTITFDPYKHVIWIPTRIAGGSVLNFGFDSAAARSAIDWGRAEELKIPFSSLGEQYAGSGDNKARVGMTEPISV